jgi:signal transduction histidine kinase
MKWRNRAVRELIAISALAVAVVVLAVLQYRWAGEISRTEQGRLQTALGLGIKNFEQEFAYDFEQLCESFAIGPQASGSDLDPVARRRYLSWSKATSEPGLLAGLYIWRAGNPRSLSRLDARNDQFQPVPWPAELGPLAGILSEQARGMPPAIADRDAVYYPWTFYGDISALVRPLFRIRSAENESDDTVAPAGFLILQLNRAFLKQQYLPNLAGRDFVDAGFDVAIRIARAPYQDIYLSNPDFPTATAPADAVVDLVDLISAESRRRGFAPLRPSQQGAQWQLVVRHPGGSLEVAVAGWRRRNLAISFGLLGILVGGAVLTLVAARRAERLARLQMEFVAGVSHELCTPLAVIGSAAENLADGIVNDAGKVQAYGGMIREQNRRLELLVDDVLLFAAERFGRAGYELRPLDVGPVVDRALTALEAEMWEAGVAVEKEIDNPLPAVMADPTAVSKCLGNLVSNAMKYAGAKRWIAIRVRRNGGAGRGEVQVVVEDRGMGIAAADRGNIFKPFYRAQAVRNGEERGVGLGLYLVKQMMEGMGGTVSVASELGQGAKFVLHFPVSRAGEQG